MAELPKTMKAIAIREPGGPEVLELAEIETPLPAHGEILIRVNAAGVNRPDTIQRRPFGTGRAWASWARQYSA